MDKGILNVYILMKSKLSVYDMKDVVASLENVVSENTYIRFIEHYENIEDGVIVKIYEDRLSIEYDMQSSFNGYGCISKIIDAFAGLKLSCDDNIRSKSYSSCLNDKMNDVIKIL